MAPYEEELTAIKAAFVESLIISRATGGAAEADAKRISGVMAAANDIEVRLASSMRGRTRTSRVTWSRS
jgi:hypothetical protein